jgi:hypothetical protein
MPAEGGDAAGRILSGRYELLRAHLPGARPLHRDADRALPAIAHRRHAGDRVQVLYLPSEGYDSVIISTA